MVLQKDLAKQAALIGVSILLTGVFLVSAVSEKVGMSDVKESLTTVSQTENVQSTNIIETTEPYIYVTDEISSTTVQITSGSHNSTISTNLSEKAPNFSPTVTNASPQESVKTTKGVSVNNTKATTKKVTTQPKKTASIVKPTLTTAKKNQGSDSRILPNSSDLATIENEILSLINADRTNKNLKGLSNNASLKKSAATRCNELWSAFSHTRPNKKSWVTAVESSHLPSVQEVLASTTSINKNTRTSINTSSGVSQFKGTKSELSLAAKNLFYYYCNDSGAYKKIMNSSYTIAGVSVTAKYEHNYSNVLSFRCVIIVARK